MKNIRRFPAPPTPYEIAVFASIARAVYAFGCRSEDFCFAKSRSVSGAEDCDGAMPLLL